MPELPDYSCEELQRLLDQEEQRKAELEAKHESLRKDGDKVNDTRKKIAQDLKAARDAKNWTAVKVLEQLQDHWAQVAKVLNDEQNKVTDELHGVFRALEQLSDVLSKNR